MLGKLVAASTMLVSFLTTTPVFAWGSDGHRIVAALASAQLSTSARKEVDRLLALEAGESLESISTWADEHRNPATAPWHYVNFPRDSCAYDPNRDCPDGKCVVAAIEKQVEVLTKDASDEDRLRALKYLVHLVADVHQPLHAGYLDDKGGNMYQLQAFMRGSNLHALWDTGLIKNLNEDAGSTVKRLLAQGENQKVSDVTMAQSAEESCRIVAMDGFYPSRSVGSDYFQRFTPFMEQRLVLAGARLARLLNGLGSKQK